MSPLILTSCPRCDQVLLSPSNRCLSSFDTLKGWSTNLTVKPESIWNGGDSIKYLVPWDFCVPTMWVAFRKRLLLPIWSEWPCVLITTSMSVQFNPWSWNCVTIYQSILWNLVVHLELALNQGSIPRGHGIHNDFLSTWLCYEGAGTVGFHDLASALGTRSGVTLM